MLVMNSNSVGLPRSASQISLSGLPSGWQISAAFTLTECSQQIQKIAAAISILVSDFSLQRLNLTGMQKEPAKSSLALTPKQEGAKQKVSQILHYSSLLQALEKSPKASLCYHKEQLSIQEKHHFLELNKTWEEVGSIKKILHDCEIEISQNPSQVLDCLDTLKQSSWYQRILRSSPTLQFKLEEVYQKAMDQTVRELDQLFLQEISQIKERELYYSRRFSSPDKIAQFKHHCPHLAQLKEITNNVAYQTAQTILSKTNLNARVAAMSRFIFLAHSCMEQNNIAAAQAIYAGLNLPCVLALATTKEELDEDAQAALANLENYFDQHLGTLSNNLAAKDKEEILADIGCFTPNLDNFLGICNLAHEQIDVWQSELGEKQTENQRLEMKFKDQLGNSLAKAQDRLFRLSEKVKQPGAGTLVLTRQLSQQIREFLEVDMLSEAEAREKKEAIQKTIQHHLDGIKYQTQKIEKFTNVILAIAAQAKNKLQTTIPSPYANFIKTWHQSKEGTQWHWEMANDVPYMKALVLEHESH